MRKSNILLLFVLILSSGCATLLNKNHQTVYIDSHPKGAQVRSNKLDRRAETPTYFSFHKGGDVSLSLSKEGYKDQVFDLEKKIAPSFFGNFLFLDLFPVGLAIDFLSGAMWNYQDAVFVELEQEQAEPAQPALSGEAATSSLPHQELRQVAPSAPIRRYNISSQSLRPKSNFSGPRLGLAYLDTKAVRALNGSLSRQNRAGHEKDHAGHFMTEFGWSFEKRFPPPDGAGITFFMETVPLVGGIDRNLILPGITTIMGIRTKNGIKLGMGPSISYNDYDATFETGVVLGGGITFKNGTVDIPLDIAIAPAQDGATISLLTGFNR